MSLRTENGREWNPFAAIPDSHAQKEGGILICESMDVGGAGRVAFTREYLVQFNPPEIVDGYFANLSERFFTWCDQQQKVFGKHNSKRTEFSLEEGDLFPIGMDLNEGWPNSVVTPIDTRKPREYMMIGAGDIMFLRHEGKRLK